MTNSSFRNFHYAFSCRALECFLLQSSNPLASRHSPLASRHLKGNVPVVRLVDKEAPYESQPKWSFLNGVSNFAQRFLRDGTVLSKTLETSMQHLSENSESGGILDNSQNSLRYRTLPFKNNFVKSIRGGKSLDHEK